MLKGILDEICAMKLQLEVQTQSTSPLATAIVDQHKEPRNVIVGAVRQIVQTHGHNHLSVSPSTETSSDIIAKAFLKNNLQFLGMHDRHEEVTEAFEHTFEWTYCDPSFEKPWNSFSSWLKEGRGEKNCYWVNGKPGSGKSTLMRYLLENPKTTECLKIWGGQSPVDVASFFFWNGGTLEQRSVTGLRSVLYDILRTKIYLVQRVLPELWDLEQSRLLGLPVSNSDAPKWTFRKLKKAFQRLLEHEDARTFKLCLFIDGLDEYQGDFEDIADFCLYLASFPNMKVCASSRPLVVFEETFQGLPALKLHDLTYNDIETFVSGKLHNHKGMLDLVRLEPEQAPELVREIVKAANGVFLWVRLAIDSLLEGLRNRDRISDLQRRLATLPRGLDDFYRMMFSKIPCYYLEHASQLFQIVRESQYSYVSLSVQGLYFADETINLPTKAALKELSLNELERISETVNLRLKSTCVGFLEIATDTSEIKDSYDISCDILTQTVAKTRRKVQHIHRSAKDFFGITGYMELTSFLHF